jgi:hypothetical protein
LGKLDDVSFVCSSLRCVLKVYRLRILRGSYDDIIEPLHTRLRERVR